MQLKLCARLLHTKLKAPTLSNLISITSANKRQVIDQVTAARTASSPKTRRADSTVSNVKLQRLSSAANTEIEELLLAGDIQKASAALSNYVLNLHYDIHIHAFLHIAQAATTENMHSVVFEVYQALKAQAHKVTNEVCALILQSILLSGRLDRVQDIVQFAKDNHKDLGKAAVILQLNDEERAFLQIQLDKIAPDIVLMPYQYILAVQELEELEKLVFEQPKEELIKLPLVDLDMPAPLTYQSRNAAASPTLRALQVFGTVVNDSTRTLQEKQWQLEMKPFELELASTLDFEESNPLRKLIKNWTDVIVSNLEQVIRDKSESKSIIHALTSLKQYFTLHELAVCGLLPVLSNTFLSRDGSTLFELAGLVGNRIHDLVLVKHMQKNITQYKNINIFARLIKLQKALQDHNDNERLAFMKRSKKLYSAFAQTLQLNSVIHFNKAELGRKFISIITTKCRMPKQNDPDSSILAVDHKYIATKEKRVGYIVASQHLFNLMQEYPSEIVSTVKPLPMLVPPVAWSSYNNGGYYIKTVLGQSHVMRVVSAAQSSQLWKVGDEQLFKIYKALSVIQNVPWQVNKDILKYVTVLWNSGGDESLDIPNTTDTPKPELKINLEDLHSSNRDNAESTEKNLRLFGKNYKKQQQKNQEQHSARCDLQYRLNVAYLLRNQVVYFPHNLDFRGRAYPISPYLNHMGSDVCRSLLKFAQSKPLGEKGLYWLKVHLANVFGVDKCAFDDRVKFVDDNIHNILNSADSPLGNSETHGWWRTGDKPWQTLATCIELANALRSDNPLEYASSLPIHIDGSCNGLQHYAALGGDAQGAKQVNLTPTDKPQDVYSAVANLANQAIEQGVLNNKHEAIVLQGKITRKVVKQTVMTSVYGVTFFGARLQIEKQLLDILKTQESEAKKCAQYLAKIVLQALETLFTSARQTQDWLQSCASLISNAGEPVRWLTPLGLPVVQPYHQVKTRHIKTDMQKITEKNTGDEREKPLVFKQKNAFPPNYVHSLDATHMLLTALAANENNITFAAVHDSFWTHATDIDVLAKVLREQFVTLHSAPLIKHLAEYLEKSFGSILAQSSPKPTTLPPMPARGDFDVTQVLQSQYFFN